MIHPYKIPLKRLSDNTFPRSLETVSQFVTFTGFPAVGGPPADSGMTQS
jgi:hypothetical protein